MDLHNPISSTAQRSCNLLMPVDQDDSKHPGYATQRRLCFTGAGVPVAVHERLHACVARSTGLLPAALLSKDQLGGSATGQ